MSSVKAQSWILSRALSGIGTGLLAYTPSLGQNASDENKDASAESAVHTACTHKEQGSRTVQDSEQVIVPNSKLWFRHCSDNEDHNCGFISARQT